MNKVNILFSELSSDTSYFCRSNIGLPATITELVCSAISINSKACYRLHRSARSSSLVTLARPSTSSSLRITDRSFQYASPRLWNQLPAPLSQPRTNLSNSASPSCMSGTSSIGSIDSPLSSSITPSLFHSRLKTFLFCKSFPP